MTENDGRMTDERRKKIREMIKVAMPLTDGRKSNRRIRTSLLRQWTDMPPDVQEIVLSTLEAREGVDEEEGNGQAVDTNARAIATMERDVGQE
jgi:hypothetical protein